MFGWLAQAGYLGLKFPAQYGGAGDTVAAAVLVEELARCGSGGVAAGLGAHAGIALPPILTFGTEEQKQRYLVPGLRGELLAALAITEPGAGSDVAALRTRARRTDGGWVVNGSKLYITGGVRADILVTAVATTPEGGHQGISFLIIERGEGVTSSPLRKLGWHASDTAEIGFDDVFVARGEPARARERRLLSDHGQLPVGAAADGARGGGRDAGRFELTLDALGGRTVGQATRHRLAQVATEIEAGPRGHLCGAAPSRRRAGRGARGHDRQAAHPAGGRRRDRHLPGILGLDAPAELERALRDARLGPIGGGTDEIMKEILGRSLGL